MNETGPNEDEQGRVNVYGTNKWICDSYMQWNITQS